MRSKNLLEELGIEDFHICSIPDKYDDSYVLRLPYTCREDIEHFLAILKEKKHITWRVTDTNPKTMSAGLKNIFHKVYHCQFANTKVAKSVKSPHPKHTACPASMKITIKKVPKRCRSKDIYLPNYPTIIRINNNHNHLLFSADNLKYKDVSDEARTKFRIFFESGHSPHSALDMHKIDLLLEHEQNFDTLVADRSHCPDIRWCYRLHSSIRAAELGKTKAPTTLEYLHNKMKKLSSQYPDLMNISKYENKPVVVICTQLMKRTHTLLSQSEEIMYLDSTENFDRFNNRMFVLLTSGLNGPLPLGIIITSSEQGAAIESGLRSILKLVGKTAFHSNRKGPKVIMSSRSSEERDALKAVFPDSHLLFCTARILQTVWRILWKKDNPADDYDKPEVFHLVKRLMYSSTELDLNNIYSDITMKNKIFDKYPSVKQFIYDVWKDRHSWGLCFQKKLEISEYQNDNNSDSASRILKDIIFSRRKPYNIVQVIDFLCSRFDLYYGKILFDMYVEKDNSVQFRNNLFHCDITNLEIENLTESIYRVHSESKSINYIVDSELQLCNCNIACLDALCSHRMAVLTMCNINTRNHLVNITDEQRKLMYLLTMQNDSSKKEKNQEDIVILGP